MHTRRWWVTPKPFQPAGHEVTLKACGVGVAMLPGYSWVPPSSTAHSVNVGTTPMVPSAVVVSLTTSREGSLPADVTGVGRRTRSSASRGKPGTWRRGPASPLCWIERPGDAGEYRRSVHPWWAGTGDSNSISYRSGRKARCLRRTRGEPDAVRVARPVRRAARRNPPSETTTGRSWPTQQTAVHLLTLP